MIAFAVWLKGLILAVNNSNFCLASLAMIIKDVEKGEIDGILVASLAREIIKEAYYNCNWLIASDLASFIFIIYLLVYCIIRP